MKTKQSQSSSFLKAVKKEFKFLTEKFDFEVLEENSVEQNIIYENNVTVVSIHLDKREQFVSVYLGRKSRTVVKGQDSWSYDVDDLIAVNAPKEGLKFDKFNFDWEKALRIKAFGVRNYLTHVLLGDFASFELAQREVNRRKQDYIAKLNASKSEK